MFNRLLSLTEHVEHPFSSEQSPERQVEVIERTRYRTNRGLHTKRQEDCTYPYPIRCQHGHKLTQQL